MPLSPIYKKIFYFILNFNQTDWPIRELFCRLGHSRVISKKIKYVGKFKWSSNVATTCSTVSSHRLMCWNICAHLGRFVNLRKCTLFKMLAYICLILPIWISFSLYHTSYNLYLWASIWHWGLNCTLWVWVGVQAYIIRKCINGQFYNGIYLYTYYNMPSSTMGLIPT